MQALEFVSGIDPVWRRTGQSGTASTMSRLPGARRRLLPFDELGTRRI